MTANWKTYRNEKYGFKVKYPPRFYVKEYFPRKYEDGFFSVSFAQEELKEGHNPFIGIAVIKTNLTSVQWLEEFGTPITVFVEGGSLLRNYKYFGVTGVGETEINNSLVLQFRHFRASGGNETTFVKKEPDILYEIYSHSSPMGEIPEELYHQILYTFKLIEK